MLNFLLLDQTIRTLSYLHYQWTRAVLRRSYRATPFILCTDRVCTCLCSSSCSKSSGSSSSSSINSNSTSSSSNINSSSSSSNISSSYNVYVWQFMYTFDYKSDTNSVYIDKNDITSTKCVSEIEKNVQAQVQKFFFYI